MKVELLLAIIISLAVGGGAGGLIGYNIAPKIVNNIQNVYNQNTLSTKTETMQTVLQGQFTIVSAVTNISINIKGITNLVVGFTTNSNYTSITNIVK